MSIDNVIPTVDIDCAPERIESEGFDPITRLIELDRSLESQITVMMLQPRPSMVAVAALSAQRVAISKELLKYRYRPAAALSHKSAGDELPVISISL